jgi:hypothetical protein
MIAITAGPRAFRFLLLEGYFAVRYGAEAKVCIGDGYVSVDRSIGCAWRGESFVVVRKLMKRGTSTTVEQNVRNLELR